MSTSVVPLAQRAGRFLVHLLGTVSFTLYVDPYALIVAVVASWLVTMSVIGLGRSEGHLFGYAIWLTAMVLVTALAAAHLMITAVAGWERGHSNAMGHMTPPR